MEQPTPYPPTLHCSPKSLAGTHPPCPGMALGWITLMAEGESLFPRAYQSAHGI